MTTPLTAPSGTFWWGQIIKDVNVAVPPSFGADAEVSYTGVVGLNLEPQLVFGGSGTSRASFALSVPPQMDFTPPGVSAMTVSVPPQIRFSGVGQQPAAVSLAVPPDVGFAGSEQYPRTVGLSLPPDINFSGTGQNGITLQYDAVGGGFANFGTPTWTHTATAGAYVFVDIAIYGSSTVSGVTYGGVAMTQLAVVAHNNNTGSGRTYRYGLASVAGGAKTVSVSMSGSWAVANSVSYTGVTSVATPTTVFGVNTPVTQGPITVAAGKISLQAFGIINSTLTSPNGTVRYNGHTAGLITLGLLESSSTVTFSGTAAGGGAQWSGINSVIT